MIRGIVFRWLRTARHGKGPGAIGTYLFQTAHESEKIPQMGRFTFYLALLRYSDRDEFTCAIFRALFIRSHRFCSSLANNY